MGAGFANVFLQPADAAGGGAENFRLRAEPFARRDFRLPLRGRNCRLPQNIAAFSIEIPSRNEHSAVGKLRKRRVKRSVSSRVIDSRFFTARIECARGGAVFGDLRFQRVQAFKLFFGPQKLQEFRADFRARTEIGSFEKVRLYDGPFKRARRRRHSVIRDPLKSAPTLKNARGVNAVGRTALGLPRQIQRRESDFPAEPLSALDRSLRGVIFAGKPRIFGHIALREAPAQPRGAHALAVEKEAPDSPVLPSVFAAYLAQ